MTEWAGADSSYHPCVPGGHRHWGPYGAAGILVTAKRRGRTYVLLTLRSPHVAQGETWSVPGGAVERGETFTEAAFAEAQEEVDGLDVTALAPVTEYSAECPHGCGWAYVTVIASAGKFRTLPEVTVTAGPDSWETDDVAWVPLRRVEHLELHPGLRAAWPALAERIKAAGKRESGRRAA